MANFEPMMLEVIEAIVPGEFGPEHRQQLVAEGALAPGNEHREAFDHVQELLDELPEAPSGASTEFRTEAVFRVGFMFDVSSFPRKTPLSDEECVVVDRLLFLGGPIEVHGLEVTTRPLIDMLIEEKEDDEPINSTDIFTFLDDNNLVPMEGTPTQRLYGDEANNLPAAESMIGRVARFANTEIATETVGTNALILLQEHYNETGQILLGTNEQFISEGDPDKTATAFWLLQDAESAMVPLSKTPVEQSDHEGVVIHYEDGARRTESFSPADNALTIVFETAGETFLSDGRDPSSYGTVIAGYARRSDISYIPDWLNDAPNADLPATATLEVYPNRYQIVIED